MAILKFRQSLNLVIFTCVLVLCGAASTFAQGARGGVMTHPGWQTSVDPGSLVSGTPYAYDAKGEVHIGIRNKSGKLKSYSATVEVVSKGRTFKQHVQVRGDDWGYVTFPTGFPGTANATLHTGVYQVSISVAGQGTVVSFKMNYTI